MRRGPPDPSDWTRPCGLRRHWGLARGVVFLNHGSFGACPRPVLAVQAALRRRMEAAPVQFLWRHLDGGIDHARAELARFVGARPADLVFLTNATTAVNAVANSAGLRGGDELLTTSLDYNACHNALAEAARRAGARLVTAEIPFPLRGSGEVVEAVLGAVTRRTRLAMIDHVTSNTGMVMPVARLVRELEARGVATLVDGAHAPGMLALNLSRLRPSYYTGNLHKWVCAPKGAAFLWAREDRQASLQPAVVSHGNNRPRPGHSPFQDRFDWAGTFDPTPWLCVGEAIRWMGGLLPGGWPALRARNRALTIAARRLLCARLDVEPPCPESMLGAMATIPLPRSLQGTPPGGRLDADQLRLHDEFGVEVPFLRLGRPATRWLRISAQAYNCLPDYQRLAAALERLARGG